MLYQTAKGTGTTGINKDFSLCLLSSTLTNILHILFLLFYFNSFLWVDALHRTQAISYVNFG